MARIALRSASAETSEPLLGLRRAELAGPLVPLARFREIRLHALHAPAG